MLLDELMGRACAAAGTAGLTVSLRMSYHGPVPLETPLRIHARVTDVPGPDARKVQVTGSIATEADPDTHLVTADGVFVVPDARRVRALFPGQVPASQTRLRSSAVR